MNGFEGSFLGRKDRLEDDARLECGVCWWVYDPAEGDPVWQIDPGTPFSGLPAHWRCPSCDAAPSQFMVLPQGAASRLEDAPAAQAERDLKSLRRELVENYERVAGRMRSLAVYNHELRVAVPAIGRCAHGVLAVVTTPWCMNLLLFADDADRLREGSEREHALPSGTYAFTAAYLGGVGRFESCSLFSPMDNFADQEAAVAVAREAMKLALTAPDAREGTQAVEDPSRRRLLGLGAGA